MQISGRREILRSVRVSEHVSVGQLFTEDGVETGQKGACVRNGD